MRMLSVIFAAGMAALGCPEVGSSQGAFVLDNSQLDYGVAIDVAGNYYSGSYGMEVWMHNGVSSALVEAINSTPAGLAAYNMLAADGFLLETTYVNDVMFEGSFSPSVCNMPDVSPAGSTVTLALVVWNSPAPSLMAALNMATPELRVGMVCFTQPTTNYDAVPLPQPPPLALDSDVCMIPFGLPPQVFRSPVNATALAGETVQFCAMVSAPLGGCGCQWQFDGLDVPGAGGFVIATNVQHFGGSSLALTNVQPAQAGSYSLVVWNQYGYATSSVALLTLMPPFPALSITPSGHGFYLSWPSWASDFWLETRVNDPTVNATWAGMSATPTVTNSELAVYLYPDSSNALFRLTK
jgi:hypothetical protein